MDEDKVIQEITNRINSEYSKHDELDWAGIAARKIYMTLKECDLLKNIKK